MSYQGTVCRGRYRFFSDEHGWLEVPRREVVASGATISTCSFYDPRTGMAYLEEDCDALSFLRATGQTWQSVKIEQIDSSMPRQLPAYDAADFIDNHVFVVRPDRGGRER